MENMNIQELTPKDIMCVYSGRAGKCCCGCSGKHYANPENLEVATKDRGYSYSEDEVSAKMTLKVLRTIQANEETARDEGGHVLATVGKRVYIAYFLPKKKAE